MIKLSTMNDSSGKFQVGMSKEKRFVDRIGKEGQEASDLLYPEGCLDGMNSLFSKSTSVHVTGQECFLP